jgi:hypothetical protein
LKERPQLKLVVQRPYDPQRDGAQLRCADARQELARRLGVQLDARKDPGPIAYGDADTQKALEALLAERAVPTPWPRSQMPTRSGRAESPIV